MSASGHPLNLDELPLFAGLPAPDLARLGDLLRFEDVAAGAVVVSQAEPSSEACVLLAGTFKVYIDQPDGSEVVLAVLGPGEVVGELNLIDHLGRSATVIALEPSRLVWLDEETFRTSLATMPKLAENLLALLARRLRLANAQIQALAALDIQGRVAHQLLAFADAFGETDASGNVHLDLRLTDAELAGMVGASREKVHKVLAVFSRNAYLSLDSEHRFTLHDLPALARLCP
jgi:CRP/FNR family transcriptional regulator, cyclic AMP receptor protein